VTAVLADRSQHRLGADLARLRAAGPTRAERRALALESGERRRVALLARSLARRTPDGAAIGRLDLPRGIGRSVVVKGSDPADLRQGPGTFSGRPLPGVPGTAAIAGHRTTYSAPFRHLDRLRRGDRIGLALPYATFTYRVVGTRIVAPDARWVLQRRRGDHLVLSACHPLFTARQRIVVLARLERVRVASAARSRKAA
jgi:sortase A